MTGKLNTLDKGTKAILAFFGSWCVILGVAVMLKVLIYFEAVISQITNHSALATTMTTTELWLANFWIIVFTICAVLLFKTSMTFFKPLIDGLPKKAIFGSSLTNKSNG